MKTCESRGNCVFVDLSTILYHCLELGEKQKDIVYKTKSFISKLYPMKAKAGCFCWALNVVSKFIDLHGYDSKIGRTKTTLQKKTSL